MSSHDWERFGDEVRKTVQNAIENQDYDKLNQAISKTINQAVDSVAKGVKNVTNSSQTKYTGYKTYTTDFEKAKRKNTVIAVAAKEPSKIGPILGIVLGYAFGFVALLMFLLFWLAGNLAIPGLETGFHVGAGFFGLATTGCVAAGIVSTRKLLRINRFKTYVKTIGKKEYCNVSELAGKIGKADKIVIKDLEYMIKNRWFAQGHLDVKKTCLMVTDKMYCQYRELEERKKLEQQETEQIELRKKRQQAKKSEMINNLPLETQKVIEQGDVYLQRIRACNDAIPGEIISAKIDRIEILVDKIFDRVEENPKCVSDIRKLLEYYLPTTVKLLEAYAKMDAQPAGGENIQSAKKEIEDTLDTLNVAYEKLLDGLFQETAWDVSSDISVLNTMLAQEGLKEDGLKNKVK